MDGNCASDWIMDGSNVCASASAAEPQEYGRTTGLVKQFVDNKTTVLRTLALSKPRHWQPSRYADWSCSGY